MKIVVRAILLMALLTLIAFASSFIFLKAVTPPIIPTANPQQLIYSNLNSGRLIQAWYQAEGQATQNGWSNDTAHVAGQVWEQLGDPTRAIAYWEIAAQANPSDTALRRHLADVYIQLQRWTQAGDALRHLLELTPDDNRAHYELGLLEATFYPASASAHLQFAARDAIYKDISFELLPLLSTEKPDGSIAMQVGLILASHELWPYAELAFGQAAALAAPFPEALAYLGLAKDRQGKDGSAQVTEALSFAPQNAQVLYLSGLHLRAVFDYTDSLDAFNQAVSAAPTNPAYAAELSTAYRLTGDLTSAEQWLKIAVQLSDNDPRFQALLDDFHAAFPTN